MGTTGAALSRKQTGMSMFSTAPCFSSPRKPASKQILGGKATKWRHWVELA